MEPLPGSLQDELHGEVARFVVREPRALSWRGLKHYLLYALILVVVAGALEAKGLDRAFVLFSLGSAGFVALASLAAWALPGGIAVGTDTRLVHQRPFGLGVEVTSWRELREARRGLDGSIELDPYVRRARLARPHDIVRPEDPDRVLALVQRLLREPVAAATQERAKLGTWTFESTHTPGKKDMALVRIAGAMFATMGAAMLAILVVLGVMAQPDTVPVPIWLIQVAGVGFLPLGVWMLLTGRAQRKPVRYVATATALVVRPPGGKEERIPWNEFEGSVERVQRRGRVDLRLPLRRETTEHGVRGSRVAADALVICGVRDADEVQAGLMRRLAL